MSFGGRVPAKMTEREQLSDAAVRWSWLRVGLGLCSLTDACL